MTAQANRGDWTRRQILASACAMAGTLHLGRTARGEHTQLSGQDGIHGPFKLGLQSYSLRGLAGANGRPERAKALAVTKSLGLHYWESYPAHVPMDVGMEALQGIKKEVEAAGVEVVGYGVVPFGKNAEANRRTFEFARRLGVRYLSADPDPSCFDELDKLVETYDIAIGIHNHGPGHRYGKIETIAKAIKDHHPKIGCCVDTGHFLLAKVDPVDAVRAFGPRVYGVHLKDVKDSKAFTVLGKGDLRTVDLLKALLEIKYNYCLAIEYEENPEDPVADVKDCVAEAARAIAEARKA